MRTEHFLFHVIEITSKSRVMFMHSKGISLSPAPVACYWPISGCDLDVILSLCYLE